jgi:Coenzyme PQQ synthesis protein D (PqqD)
MIRLSRTVRTVTHPDGGALLDLCAGKMFRFNATGAAILELLAFGNTEDRIVAKIGERCGVDGSLVSSEVHAFLVSLKNFGLVDEGDLS